MYSLSARPGSWKIGPAKCECCMKLISGVVISNHTRDWPISILRDAKFTTSYVEVTLELFFRTFSCSYLFYQLLDFSLKIGVNKQFFMTTSILKTDNLLISCSFRLSSQNACAPNNLKKLSANTSRLLSMSSYVFNRLFPR